MTEKKDDCVFCKLSSGELTSQTILDQDSDSLVVEDIAPHAPQHLLVIPRRHLPSPSELDASHSRLLRDMEALGRAALAKRLGSEPDEAELRMGFHWPPLISIRHLHLHLIYPARRLDFISRHFLFRPGFLFVSVVDSTPTSLANIQTFQNEWLQERIKKRPAPAVEG